MTSRSQDRLANYVRQIARKHGGLEGLSERLGQLAEARTQDAGLESTLDLEDSPLPAVPSAARTQAAQTAIRAIELGRPMTPDQMDQLEAIIDADLRPAIDIVGGTFTSTHPLWTQLSTDPATRLRIEQALGSIGRVELPGHPSLPYGGTGFIVGNDLVMTNRHVAEIFASGVGTGGLAFLPNARAAIDFARERDNVPGPCLRVRRVVMVHPYWDMALLEVEGLGARRRLELSVLDARDLGGHDIAVIGYPAFDPRNPAADIQKVYGTRFGVKRLQPGELLGGEDTGSFGKTVRAATHDSSTLGGCSGGAVLDLSSGAVLGLHFGGRSRERNYAVPSSELSRDARVTQAGVRFDGRPAPGANDWAAWWARADAGEALSLPVVGRTLDGDNDADGDKDGDHGDAGDDAGIGAGDDVAVACDAASLAGELRLEIPIVVTVTVGPSRPSSVSVGRPRRAVPGDDASADLMDEAMVEPFRDSRYAGRKGYDEDFLGRPDDPGLSCRAPMPTAQNPEVLAPTRAGADVLHYQNFSIRMHGARRLALVTASNVTAEEALRRPEKGRNYTRAGLSGLRENDVEQWFIDPRMEPRYQLPDVFFTKDRKAFDKGHVVRRDDVAWGRTYAALRRANGDTYHVTNCSPQVAGFNQSAKGADNWGDLENQVLTSARSERLCVFAGPVLDDVNDQVFHGVGAGGTALRARIPVRFWKVIVSREGDGLAAYGFVLEQDLTQVEFEYVPAPAFVRRMKPIAVIAEMASVAFDPAVVAADQYDAVPGLELALRAGLERVF